MAHRELPYLLLNNKIFKQRKTVSVIGLRVKLREINGLISQIKVAKALRFNIGNTINKGKYVQQQL
jgi:hypothetical protein